MGGREAAAKAVSREEADRAAVERSWGFGATTEAYQRVRGAVMRVVMVWRSLVGRSLVGRRRGKMVDLVDLVRDEWDLVTVGRALRQTPRRQLGRLARAIDAKRHDDIHRQHG